MCKRIIAVIVSVIIAIAAPFTAYSSDNNTLEGVKSSVEGVISYKCNSLNVNSIENFLDALSEGAGDFNSDWYYIAMSRYGINCKNQKSISALKKAVDGFYNEGLKNVKITDMQRVAFALLSCGEDITSVNGHNLLADSTYNHEKYKPLDSQGVNSLSYALLLLDSKKYPVPKNNTLTRDKIINKILSYELEKGGYALFGSGADIDIISIVLQALAPYRDNKSVKSSIESCLDILDKRQDNSGAYKSFSGKITSESTAQVIIALTSLNINIFKDSRFIKNGNTLLDGLSLFRMSDGGYCHMQGYKTNGIATYQSLCALVSAYRYLKNGGVFYDYSTAVKSTVKSVNKAIKKHTVKMNKSKESKTKSAKTTNKSSVSNSSTSTQYNSRTDYNSNTEIKENNNPHNKNNKISKPNYTETISSATEIRESTADESKKNNKNNSDKRENKPAPLYTCFAIMFIGYAVLFVVKARGKK